VSLAYTDEEGAGAPGFSSFCFNVTLTEEGLGEKSYRSMGQDALTQSLPAHYEDVALAIFQSIRLLQAADMGQLKAAYREVATCVQIRHDRDTL
jgi:hypothetical protein